MSKYKNLVQIHTTKLTMQNTLLTGYKYHTYSRARDSQSMVTTLTYEPTNNIGIESKTKSLMNKSIMKRTCVLTTSH